MQKGVGDLVNEGVRIDVLIKDAGFGIFGPVEETPLAEARAQLETNFFGAVRMIQALLPHMRKNGGGLILNISSLVGLMGLPFQGFYSASKFALEGLTESLRMEVRPFHIHIVNINPGDFQTSFTDRRKFIQKSSGVYRHQQEISLQVVEQAERNEADPNIIGPLVEKLINRQNGHRVRYLACKRNQTLAVAYKRLLGADFFEKILSRALKIH